MDRFAHMTASNSKQLSERRTDVFYCPTFPVITFAIFLVEDVKLEIRAAAQLQSRCSNGRIKKFNVVRRKLFIDVLCNKKDSRFTTILSELLGI